MFQYLLDPDPRLLILIQHPTDQILRRIRHLQPTTLIEVDPLLHYVPRRLLPVHRHKRHPIRQQHVQDDPQGPKIRILGVRLAHDDLGGAVHERPVGVGRTLIWEEDFGETEVDEFGDRVAEEEGGHGVIGHHDVF